MKHDSHNILHVVNIYFVLPYFIGGQFRYFEKKGYRLHVVCSASEYLSGYAAEQGFDYREVPVKRSLSPWRDLLSVLAICRYIREKNIGIVVGHTPKGGLLAMLAGWLMRVPNRIYFRHGLVYQTSHGLKRLMLMMVDRLTSLLAHKIVCVSESVLQQSIADKLAPARKQRILGHGTCCGIDTEGRFNPENIDGSKLQSMKGRWGICRDDWVIGYSGRLVHDKGIVELVDAYRLLRSEESIPNLRLLLVGPFEERDALPTDIQEYIRSDEGIVWTDFQNADMEYFYAMMNVYVIASYREGIPTGALEAQSMGVPVVTSRATGCIDCIVEGRTGLFVGHDGRELADAVLRICHGEIAGRAGRQWVRENFENHIVWEDIERLYKSGMS